MSQPASEPVNPFPGDCSSCQWMLAGYDRCVCPFMCIICGHGKMIMLKEERRCVDCLSAHFPEVLISNRKAHRKARYKPPVPEPRRRKVRA